MPDDDRPELLEADTGGETSAGTTALLQALMSMVGETLHRMELRLATIEETLQTPEEPGPDLADQVVGPLLARLDSLSGRLERLEVRDPTEALQAPLTRLEGQLAVMTAEVSEAAEGRSRSSDEMATVAAGIESLGRRLEQLEARDPVKVVLDAAVGRLDELSGAVDSIGYGLASMADLMTASSNGSTDWPEGLREALVALGDDVADLRLSLPVQPVDELQDAVRSLEGQVTLLTAQLSTQPGPGAALAMVAAGLAERFEERTQTLTELLGTHAAYVRQTWERIEGLLDGGTFDELAVGEAMEHVIDNQERMADSVQRLVTRLEELDERAVPPPRPPREDTVAREALASLGAGMEGLGARVDDVRRRLAALAAALEASTQGTVDADEPDTASPLGRRASSAGRRLATDLGLRGRARPRPPEGGQPRPRG